MNPIYTGAIQAVRGAGFLWLLPLLPLSAAAVNGLFGHWIERSAGRKACHAVSLVAAVGALLVAARGGVRLAALAPEDRFLRDTVAPLFDTGALRVDLAFALDPLAVALALAVTLLAVAGHVAAAGAPRDDADAGTPRALASADLLAAGLLVFALGDSLLLALVGWGAAGLAVAVAPAPRGAAGAGGVVSIFTTGRCAELGVVFAALALLGAAPSPVRAITVDAGHGGAGMEIRHQGDRDPRASIRDVRLGPTLVPREWRDQIAITEHDGARPYESALRAQRLGERFDVPALFGMGVALLAAALLRAGPWPLPGWLASATGARPPLSALLLAFGAASGFAWLARMDFLLVLSPGALLSIGLAGAVVALAAGVAAAVADERGRALAWLAAAGLGQALVAAGAGAADAGVALLLAQAPALAALVLAPRDPRGRRASWLATVALIGVPGFGCLFANARVVGAAVTSPTFAGDGRWLAAASLLALLASAFAAVRAHLRGFAAPSAAANVGRAVPEGGSGGVDTASASVGAAPAGFGSGGVALALAALATAAVPVLVAPLAGDGASLLGRWLEPAFPPAAIGGGASSAVIAATSSLAAAVAGLLLARALYRDPARTVAWREATAARWRPWRRVPGADTGPGALWRALAVRPAQELAAAVDRTDRRLASGGDQDQEQP